MKCWKMANQAGRATSLRYFSAPEEIPGTKCPAMDSFQKGLRRNQIDKVPECKSHWSLGYMTLQMRFCIFVSWFFSDIYDSLHREYGNDFLCVEIQPDRQSADQWMKTICKLRSSLKSMEAGSKHRRLHSIFSILKVSFGISQNLLCRLLYEEKFHGSSPSSPPVSTVNWSRDRLPIVFCMSGSMNQWSLPGHFPFLRLFKSSHQTFLLS